MSPTPLPESKHSQRIMALVVVPTMKNAYHHLKDFVAIQPSMGLMSIGASVETSSRTAVIIDGDAEELTFNQTAERIVVPQPDYVGATVMTATMNPTCNFFKALKARLPQAPAIVGGLLQTLP